MHESSVMNRAVVAAKTDGFLDFSKRSSWPLSPNQQAYENQGALESQSRCKSRCRVE